MGDVINLNARRQHDVTPGNNAFALCGCTKAGTPFNVVVIFDHDMQMTITGLVCPDCEAHVPIAYGQIDSNQ